MSTNKVKTPMELQRELAAKLAADFGFAVPEKDVTKKKRSKKANPNALKNAKEAELRAEAEKKAAEMRRLSQYSQDIIDQLQDTLCKEVSLDWERPTEDQKINQVNVKKAFVNDDVYFTLDVVYPTSQTRGISYSDIFSRLARFQTQMRTYLQKKIYFKKTSGEEMSGLDFVDQVLMLDANRKALFFAAQLDTAFAALTEAQASFLSSKLVQIWYNFIWDVYTSSYNAGDILHADGVLYVKPRVLVNLYVNWYKTLDSQIRALISSASNLVNPKQQD